MRVATRFISVLLTPLVTFVTMAAQTPPITTANNSQPAALQIRLLDRDPLQIAAGSRGQKSYTVLVTDSSGNPVADAAVACRLPDSDPTGMFAQGGRSAVLFTGRDGRASIPEVQWGSAAGMVGMRVTANKDSEHAAILIEQTLVAPIMAATPPAVSVIRQRAKAQPLAQPKSPSEDPAVLARRTLPAIAAPDQPAEVSVTKPPASEKVGHSSKKKWIILAIAAGAAAGAAGFAAKGKSSSSSSSTQMSVGSPTISVGQP
jgi:hypothetical protein